MPWKGCALEKATDLDEYQTYLQKFCRDFVFDMMELIDQNVQSLQVIRDLN